MKPIFFNVVKVNAKGQIAISTAARRHLRLKAGPHLHEVVMKNCLLMLVPEHTYTRKILGA